MDRVPSKVADSRLYQTAVKPAYKLQGHCASLNRNQDPFFAVICDFKRTDFGIGKNFPERKF